MKRPVMLGIQWKHFTNRKANGRRLPSTVIVGALDVDMVDFKGIPVICTSRDSAVDLCSLHDSKVSFPLTYHNIWGIAGLSYLRWYLDRRRLALVAVSRPLRCSFTLLNAVQHSLLWTPRRKHLWLSTGRCLESFLVGKIQPRALGVGYTPPYYQGNLSSHAQSPVLDPSSFNDTGSRVTPSCSTLEASPEKDIQVGPSYTHLIYHTLTDAPGN